MPLELLPILHVAALAIKVAREQIPVLQAHKERCTLLINRSDRLLVEISAQYENGGTSIIQPKISILESACISVRDTVRELSGKGLAWRLLHQEQMEKAIMASEAKLNDACNVFQVGAHISIGEMQAAIAEAAKRDHQQFIVYLEGISQNDQRIIDALRASNLRLEETLTALLKHIQSRSNAGNDEQPSERFIRRAVDVLKKVSIGFVRDDIAPWEITSLEVEYEAVEDACIGVGGFGKVFRGYWHGEVVAVKEMHETLAMDVRNDRHFKAFEKEIRIWHRLSHHPRIVPFYGACLEAEKPFLVIKYCPNGSIMNFIRENPESNRLLLLHQISVGMMYLHDQSIIHADLKPANILIGDDEKAMICDFGLSQLKDQVVSTQSNSRIIQGTPNYMAPEYLEGDPIDYPVDVYSFGMTAWQIHTGLIPFNDVPRRSFYRWVIDKKNRPNYPDSMNKTLWTLLQECWQHDPVRRPTFTGVEATLKSLTKSSSRRLSMGSSQMLMLPQLPSPPVSPTGSSGYRSQVLSPDSTQLSAQLQNQNDNDWFPVPATPISYPISPNSINVFNRTLHVLYETQSLDKLVQDTLLCYPNWLKYKSYNSRAGQRPDYVFKDRVKSSVKGFKRSLLLWIDNIPSLRGADILNGYRTLLFIVGTCAMGEHAYRQNPDAPHLYVRNFVDNIMATNTFRASVEGSVRAAWEQYSMSRDTMVLGERLVQVVNQVSS